MGFLVKFFVVFLKEKGVGILNLLKSGLLKVNGVENRGNEGLVVN